MQLTLNSWMVVPTQSGTISIVGMAGGKLVRQLIHRFTDIEIFTKKDCFKLGYKMPGSWSARLEELRPAKAVKLKSIGII